MKPNISAVKDISDHCQINYPDLAQATWPDTRSAMPLRKYWWRLKRNLWYLSILGPFKFTSRFFFPNTNHNQRQPDKASRISSLNPGDWVEVKPLKDIILTLDRDGKHKGMRFNKEQAKYAGGRFKVYKALNTLVSEADGKLLRVKTPTFLLEGVFCDGKAHGGCDRYCFGLWREAWLKKMP